MSEELERHKAALDVAFKALNMVATATDVSLIAVNACAEKALAKIAEILPPKFEKVLVGSWFVIPAEGDVYTQVSEERAAQMKNEGYSVAFFSATVERPVKRAVVREVEVEAMVYKNHGYYVDGAAVLLNDSPSALFESHPECHGKTGTLIFRWTD